MSDDGTTHSRCEALLRSMRRFESRELSAAHCFRSLNRQTVLKAWLGDSLSHLRLPAWFTMFGQRAWLDDHKYFVRTIGHD